MRHEQMPDNRLPCLGVRRDERSVHGGYDHDSVSMLGRVAPVTPDDTENIASNRSSQPHRVDDVDADALLFISAANRKDEDRIARTETAAAQPGGERVVPTLVVDAGGELGDIVCGRVALDAGDLAKVVDGVRRVT